MLNLNFAPFPTLRTERLILRQLKMEDENEVFALRSDDRVNEFLDRDKAGSIDDARKFIDMINNNIRNNESIYWGITLKDEAKIIGTIMLWNISKEDERAEIGLELHPDYQGKGIMQEAVAAVIEFGFLVLRVQTIEGYTNPGNAKSLRLLGKFRFKRDLQAEDKMEVREGGRRQVIYRLNKSTHQRTTE